MPKPSLTVVLYSLLPERPNGLQPKRVTHESPAPKGFLVRQDVPSPSSGSACDQIRWHNLASEPREIPWRGARHPSSAQRSFTPADGSPAAERVRSGWDVRQLPSLATNSSSPWLGVILVSEGREKNRDNICVQFLHLIASRTIYTHLARHVYIK